ncbi:E3 UFM1-protein ligase 1 homolog [Zophobas morio]|uniref:E3 UFM1-protein ligase 1 homolog n=1 Tax=Zophobas morio TaxID=2755281 RepID=UPI0030831E65
MGEVDLTFISNHFKLPKETLLKIIEDAGIPILRGRASNSHLIAPTSFKSVRCHKVLGVFRALTKPLLLSVIKDKYHFQDDLYDVVRGLIQEKLLLGTIDNAQKEMIYTPAIYNSLREQWLRETLCHNGYLESSRALAMGIPNTSIKRYCNQFLDGVLLSTLFIGKELLRQLYDTFRELLFWKGFISLNELKDFTSCLTMKDWEILLSFLNSASGNFDKAFETLQSIQLEGGCGSLAQTNFDIIFINKKMLCTRQFIDQLSDLLKSTVQNLAVFFKYYL